VIVVRYADDVIVGFQHKSDAERFWRELRDRFRKFNLELHSDKTHLIEFGRFAAENREARGAGKPETFEFLGFTHICATKRNGKFKVLRLTSKKKMRAKLATVKKQLRWRLHHPVPEVGEWLRKVVVGHANYYGVPGNSRAINQFRVHVIGLWYCSLRRRSQMTRLT
jgi:RNA-directed DNA polymerase